jgi:STE24 endopeptidase
MYIVVIGIFAIVLTLSGPLVEWVTSPPWILVAVGGATLLPAILAAWVCRSVVRRLDRDPEHPARAQAAFRRGMLYVQVLLALAHGAVLLTTDWQRLCASVPVIGGWPAVPGVLALIPFVLSVLLVWTALYPADRGVRQIALEIYLFRGRPLRPVWPLLDYLVYNLRHQMLFILVPMVLILLAHDIIVIYQNGIRTWTGLQYAPDLLVGTAALGVAVISPELLRHVWLTERLHAGPLRDRLLVLARRLKLRCRDILVWRSGGMIVNAAVMGVIGPLRYVLITDAMIEQMDDTKIEAVFGHEAGHAKRHHILYFLLFAAISGCAVTIFSIRTQTLARTDETVYQLLSAGLGLLLAAKWGLLFGWISRRFERQADVFGVRTLALSGLPCVQPCALHSPAARGAGGDPLCATAAHVFADALHEVAVRNGIRPDSPSWRHSSIASRSRFVQWLAQDPRRTARFEARLCWIQRAILVAAIAAGAWAAYDLQIWATIAGWFG